MVQSPTWRLAVLLLAIASIGSGCQPAEDPQPQPPPAATSTPVAVDEKLWFTPPKDWTLVSNQETNNGINKSLVRHLRYADPTEATHILTLESRYNNTLGPAGDPLNLLDQLAQNAQQSCDTAEDFNTFTGYEHGVATAVRLFVCDPTELQGGRVMLLKILQGQEQTYLVALQHQWSGPAASEQSPESLELARSSHNLFDRVAVWSLYLRDVRLCPTKGCEQDPT